MAENKVEFGLSKAYFAPYTQEGEVITFEKPIALPGSVSLALEPKGELSEFYADNIVYYVSNSNQGYEITYTIAKITDEFAQKALGEEKNEEYGVMDELANVVNKPFAFLYQIEGDQKESRRILYNCTASRPSENANTKEDATEIEGQELTLVASPLEMDGRILVKTKTLDSVSTKVYDKWFDQVFVAPPKVTIAQAGTANNTADQLVIAYDKPLYTVPTQRTQSAIAGASLTANFVLTKAAGTAATITSATHDSTGNKVTIVIPTAVDGDTITVTGLQGQNTYEIEDVFVYNANDGWTRKAAQ